MTRVTVQHADEARSRPGQELLLKLQGLLEDFLSCGYGPLMEVVRKQLEPGLSLSRLSPSDFLRFVQLARLCTSYVHQKEVCRAPTCPASQHQNATRNFLELSIL